MKCFCAEMPLGKVFVFLGTGVLLVAVLRGELVQGHRGTAESTVEKKQQVTRYPNVESVVSIVELLADPDKYDGKRVLIEGFFRNAFEDTAIYLNRESAEYGIAANAIWVDTDESVARTSKHTKSHYERLNGKYVAIEARYNKSELGHGGSYQGELENITRVWELKRVFPSTRR